MKKRDFETYQKRFRDFEIVPKFSETHVFRGTIRHPCKAVVVYMQDRGFNSSASNMIKLSVNDTKWSSLPGPALLFFIFRFENLISGLSRNGRSVSPVNGCMEEMG